MVGNGLDIQLGGNDFQNKWILVRLLADAKSGKYDDLFKSESSTSPSISGDDLVTLFMKMPLLGNKARNGEFDKIIDKLLEPEIFTALNDFKSKYGWVITSPEQIGLEDWLLLLRLFLQEQFDLLPLFISVKQGFERVVLDAIYCNGMIQQIYKNAGNKAKEFFSDFDTLFTLNYDSNLEKLSGKPVHHLHGDFETAALSENPNTAYGFLRKQNGETIYFPKKFKHCYSNAILDYSGDNKYKLAVGLSSATAEFGKLKSVYSSSRSEFNATLSRFPAEQQKIIRVGMEQNLPVGWNYHFNDLDHLTGELTIIGIAPQNDNHIFECINRSSINKVIFYHFFSSSNEPTPVLPISKSYEVKDVSKLWANIGIKSPTYSSLTAQSFQFRLLNNRDEALKFIELVNVIVSGKDPVNASDIYNQLKSIPEETEKSIIGMMKNEIQKDGYHTRPESEEALSRQLKDFSKTLMTSSLSPQALYFMYIINPTKLSKKKRSNKIKKRR